MVLRLLMESTREVRVMFFLSHLQKRPFLYTLEILVFRVWG